MEITNRETLNHFEVVQSLLKIRGHFQTLFGTVPQNKTKFTQLTKYLTILRNLLTCVSTIEHF